MATVFEAAVRLDLKDRFSAGMKRVQANTRNATKAIGKQWEKNAKRMRENWEKSMKGIERGQKRMQSGMMMMAKGAAIGAPFALAAKSFGQYEKGLGEVATLTSKTTAQIIGEYGNLVDSTTSTFGQQSQGVIKAFYDGLSAGVPETEKSVKEYLDAVGKMAVGGVTDMTSAADAITTAMNAWGTNDFGKISDVMFGAVKAGKTTITELSASLGQVAPVAGSAGVTIEETMAAVAALTATGVKTPQAMTQIQASISSLLKPASEVKKHMEKLGLEITPLTLKSKGLAGTIEDVMNAVNAHTKSEEGREDAFNKLFPNMEAYKAMTVLAKTQNKKFTDTLSDMTTKTGVMDEAFKKISETSAFQFEQALGQLKVSWKDLGAAAMPVLSDILEAIGPVIKDVGGWIKENKDLVGSVVKIGLAVSGFAIALGTLKTVYGVVTIAQWALNAALTANPIGLVIMLIGGLIAAGIYLYKNWDVVTAQMGLTWEILSDRIRQKAEIIKETFSALGAAMKALFSGDLAGLEAAGSRLLAAKQKAESPYNLTERMAKNKNISVAALEVLVAKKEQEVGETRIDNVNIEMKTTLDPTDPQSQRKAQDELKKMLKNAMDGMKRTSLAR